MSYSGPSHVSVGELGLSPWPSEGPEVGPPPSLSTGMLSYLTAPSLIPSLGILLICHAHPKARATVSNEHIAHCSGI